MRLPLEERDQLIDHQQQEIARLKNEIDQLRGECSRLQQTLNETFKEVAKGEVLNSSQNLTKNQNGNSDIEVNEAIMEAFFDASPGILNVFDQNLCYIKSDKLTPTYFGLNRKNIIGKSVRDLNPVFAREFLQPMLERILDSRQTVQDLIVEGPVPSRKNEKGFWSMSYFPVPLPGGEIGMGCVGVDITDTKRAEHDLARERQLFEGIIENIPVMITLYDPDFQNFRFNKEFKKVLAWEEEDASDGKFLEKVYPDPDYRKAVIEYMNSLAPGWKEYNATAKNGTVVESSWANILLASGVQIGIGLDIRERKKIEGTLRDNERRLQAIFNNAAIGIVEVDDHDQFIFANRRMCEMLHYTNEELLQKTVFDITADEDLEITMLHYKQLHLGEINSISTEKRYKKKNGSLVWVHKYVSVIRDSKGNYLKSIGTVEDISERKVVEQALHRSEERLRLLADNISQMTWISDGKGIPIWFNKRWYEFTGLPFEEMRNNLQSKINHPDDASRVYNSFLQAVNMGEPWEETYRMRNKSGEYRWFLSRSQPIQDDKGRITLWFGTSTDITGQKKAEEDALNKAAEIEAILSCIPDGILVYNKQGSIVRSNAVARGYLGYNENEYSHKISQRVSNHFTVWTEEGKRLTPEEMPAYKSAVEAETIVNQILRMDGHGKSRWYIFNAGPLIISGKHNGAVLSMLDITSRKQTEQMLSESEARFRMLADNISQIAWIANNQGDIVWFNKRWFDYTGITLEEMRAGGRTKIHHPNYSGPVLESFHRSIKSGEAWEYIYPMRSKEGTFRWFLGRAHPIRNNHGDITLWFGTNTDITEQRITEEALRNSEQRLQAIFNNAAIGIVEVDMDDKFIYVNDRICQMLNYNREELLGKSVDDITAPEFRDKSSEMNGKLHLGENDLISYEKQYVKRTGEYIWVHVSISTIRDEQGKHLRSIGTVDDISERVKIQQDLVESEEKFRLLFENITEGVALHELVYDRDIPVNYRLLDVNPAYRENCGIQAEMAVGNLSTVVYGTDKPPYFDEFSKVALTREPYRFETFFKNLNRYFIINVISPKKGQFATVFEDITDQKRNEQEIKQKNEELTRFIYTVSHDLKSPLVTIKSFTAYLKEDIENQDHEAQAKDIKYIMNAADKMGRLLDELLELSRIGRKEEQKENVPLKTIANIALDLVAGQISDRGVKVEMIGPETILHGHIQRLIQLYQNLIDNAVKFMGNQPEPLIEIGSMLNPERNNEIVMFVRDNGIGIDPRYHHKIFGLFEKLDNNTEGTGIGLALIKRIVEVHGGTIWFESKGLNHGTTFYFTMAHTHIQDYGKSVK